MPLRYYKCIYCQKVVRHISEEVVDLTCQHLNEDKEEVQYAMNEVIKSPNGKFMVAANKGTGTSKLKDSKSILTERARNHNRETLLDDNIALNRDNKLGTAHNFLNEKGERRRKIDDI